MKKQHGLGLLDTVRFQCKKLIARLGSFPAISARKAYHEGVYKEITTFMIHSRISYGRTSKEIIRTLHPPI